MTLTTAAVIHSGNGEGDSLLNEILLEHQQKDWNIRGLVTEQGKDVANNKAMSVRDIHSGKIYVISQKLGRESRGCSLDFSSLADAGEVLRNVITGIEQGKRPDLVFINRFGHGESNGKGLCDEFADLISAAVPVLTLVSEKYLKNWLNFSGGLAENLPLDRSAIIDWLERVSLNKAIPLLIE